MGCFYTKKLYFCPYFFYIHLQSITNLMRYNFYAKQILFTLLLLVGTYQTNAQVQVQTYTYAKRATESLQMDIYTSKQTPKEPQKCILFMFGGGFKEGNRADADYLDYFHYFAQKGFLVASIDYRLGMKNQAKAPSKLNFKPLKNAIEIAMEDLYTATNYLLKHAQTLHIDTSRIIVSGSSAGAVAMLQATYERASEGKADTILPKKFRYAGAISFAGSIFSLNWGLKYKKKAIPTLFFHGSADKLVPYNKIKLLHIGMYGSKSLAKVYRKNNFPYLFYTIENSGHEIAEDPMKMYLPEIEKFITDYIIDQQPWMIDINIYDPTRQPTNSLSPDEYYD